MPKINPKVCTIILNWNGRNDTLACLDSLQQNSYLNHEIIVVDNGSKDDSVEQIKSLHPSVTLLETGKNLGYAEGNNVGINYALEKGADYIFIVNNDTVISENCIAELIATASKTPSAGILSPIVMYYDEPEIIWYAGTLLDESNYHFSRDADGQHIDNFSRKSPYKTITGAGCALMIPSKIFRKIGPFYKDYFLYWEEMDLSYRVSKIPYDIVVVPSAKIWHKVGSSFDLHKEQASKVTNYFWQRNRLLWAKRNLGSLKKWHIYYLTLKRLSPKIYINKDINSPIYKLLYWSIRETLLNYTKRLSDPIYRASLLGVYHFIIGRFGDCPDSIKKSIK